MLSTTSSVQCDCLVRVYSREATTDVRKHLVSRRRCVKPLLHKLAEIGAPKLPDGNNKPDSKRHFFFPQHHLHIDATHQSKETR